MIEEREERKELEAWKGGKFPNNNFRLHQRILSDGDFSCIILSTEDAAAGTMSEEEIDEEYNTARPEASAQRAGEWIMKGRRGRTTLLLRISLILQINSYF